MPLDSNVKESLSKHPCFNPEAHTKYARMHVPIAPRCNIQCNYCNRDFDCPNESRPGVTSDVLSPEEAIAKIEIVKKDMPELSVIGIAGPGDPLANDETFRFLELLKASYPGLVACISTNGLLLPEQADRLYDLGVRFVTVTMNAVDASVGSKIYDHIIIDGMRATGDEASKILIQHQLDGIEKCSKMGMAVKVNIVMIPGINTDCIPDLVKIAKNRGAYVINILPLIPVKGTRFQDLKAPTPKQRMELMDRCSLNARMMRHCRQCRADAVGLLNDDRSSCYSGLRLTTAGCSARCVSEKETSVKLPGSTAIAVATDSSDNVCGFGSAPSFSIFELRNGVPARIGSFHVDRDSPVSGDAHRKHIASIIEGVNGCGSVIVSEIGDMPKRMLTDSGITVSIFKGAVSEAVKDAFSVRAEPFRPTILSRHCV